MTFQTAYQQVQAEVDDFETDSLVVIKQAIVDGCYKIWQALSWSFKDAHDTVDVVASQQDYVLATVAPTLEKVTAIGYKATGQNGYTPLDILTLEQFLALNTDPTVTGQPTAACIHQGRIKLYPTPDASGTDALELWNDESFTEPSADADVLPIPGRYFYVLKRFAKAQFWDFDDDTRASGEYQKFLDDLKDIKADDTSDIAVPKRGRMF